MAASHFKVDQYDAEHFVESVGAIAIKTSTREICLIHYVERDEWLLAKGRRNVGESRLEAALREIKEETGYTCRMLPLTMTARAPPAVENSDCPDEPTLHKEVCEPFMFTCRHLEEGRDVKLIWWYVAAIDETAVVERGEDQFNIRLFDFEEALRMLTFENDRKIVRKAIQIFEDTELTPSIAPASSG
jgi:8-oxo-dGTP pyrophosphatase MutT (NUDIX family)